MVRSITASVVIIGIVAMGPIPTASAQAKKGYFPGGCYPPAPSRVGTHGCKPHCNDSYKKVWCAPRPYCPPSYAPKPYCPPFYEQDPCESECCEPEPYCPPYFGRETYRCVRKPYCPDYKVSKPYCYDTYERKPYCYDYSKKGSYGSGGCGNSKGGCWDTPGKGGWGTSTGGYGGIGSKPSFYKSNSSGSRPPRR